MRRRFLIPVTFAVLSLYSFALFHSEQPAPKGELWLRVEGNSGKFFDRMSAADQGQGAILVPSRFTFERVQVKKKIGLVDPSQAKDLLADPSQAKNLTIAPIEVMIYAEGEINFVADSVIRLDGIRKDYRFAGTDGGPIAIDPKDFLLHLQIILADELDSAWSRNRPVPGFRVDPSRDPDSVKALFEKEFQDGMRKRGFDVTKVHAGVTATPLPAPATPREGVMQL